MPHIELVIIQEGEQYVMGDYCAIHTWKVENDELAHVLIQHSDARCMCGGKRVVDKDVTIFKR